MKIDLDAYNLLASSCCDCATLPGCTNNSIKCESYSVGDCGYSFFAVDATSATPLSESCKIYTKKRMDYSAAVNTTSKTTVGSQSATELNVLTRSQFADYKQIWRAGLSAGDPRYCSDEVTTQFNSDGTNTTKIGDSIWESSHAVYESSSSPSNECNGTETFTYFNGVSSTTSVYDFDTCYLLDWHANDAWTFEAPAIFTLEGSQPLSEGTTGSSTYSYKIEWSEQLTSAMLSTELDLRVEGLTAWPGTACASYVAASFVYEPLSSEPISGVPQPPHYPPLSAQVPPVCTQEYAVSKTRYKMGIPDDWQSYRRDKDRYDACILAATTPEETEACGDNPQLSSYDVHKYFAIQWDVVFFPYFWEQWNNYYIVYRQQIDAHAKWVEDYATWEEDHAEWETEHAAWKTAHDAWKDTDEYRTWEASNNAINLWYECIYGGGTDCGEQPPYAPYPPNEPLPEPQEPIAPGEPLITAENPGPQPALRPEFVDENLFWTWTGTIEGSIDSFYEPTFHTIAVPSSPGESRIVNKQTKCWRSARFGSPATSIGEIYDPDFYNTD